MKRKTAAEKIADNSQKLKSSNFSKAWLSINQLRRSFYFVQYYPDLKALFQWNVNYQNICNT